LKNKNLKNKTMENDRLKRVGETFVIPFANIVIDETINNGRIDFGDIEELAKSIEESGLRIPVLVQKVRNEEKYILIQGKRRMKAIELLINRGVDFPFVKANVTPKGYSIENSLFDQIILNDGKPYTSLEQGLIFAQLSDRGYSIQEIATKTGKSTSHISSCIEIASLPKKVRDMVGSGSVSGLTAVALAKTVGSEDELIVKLEAAVENAPTTKSGEKKKITNKNIKQISELSPLKKLEAVKEELKNEGIKNDSVELFEKLLSRLKAKESVESIVELFK
jgi:ParB/RepB/Spo0J family partition protein